MEAARQLLAFKDEYGILLVNVNLEDKHKNTPIAVARPYSEVRDLLLLLRDSQDDLTTHVNVFDNEGHTELMAAVLAGDPKRIGASHDMFRISF